MLDWVRLSGNAGKLFLFLPVETKVRELDAKVLLACVAAERGHKAVVGDMVELRNIVEFLPRGIYISKSVPNKMEKYFRRYKALGYTVAGSCEEGLVILSGEYYKREKLSAGALSYTDIFLAWGKHQTELIVEKTPELKDRIRQVGNPRMDLLKYPYRAVYQKEAERLRSIYGDYILFNTNFSIANHILGAECAFLDAKKRGRFLTVDDEHSYWRFFEHRRTIFEKTIELVGTVSRSYPGRRIIVRPHPSEDHETWREAAKDLENVDVVFEGTVVPWLLGADVLIHSGCTTAVEAYLLETPAIVFRPVIREGWEYELPSRVSMQSSDADEVLKAIDVALAKGDHYQQWRLKAGRCLQDYVVADDEEGASDRIVGELERYCAQTSTQAESRIYRLVRLGKRSIKEFLRDLKYGRREMQRRRNRFEEKHRQQKLPDLSIEEIEALITDLKQKSGRFDEVHVRALGGTRRCYVVERC